MVQEKARSSQKPSRPAEDAGDSEPLQDNQGSPAPHPPTGNVLSDEEVIPSSPVSSPANL